MIKNGDDDGIEFFGGTVSVDNLVIAFQGDDGIDIDMNYSGTINLPNDKKPRPRPLIPGRGRY